MARLKDWPSRLAALVDAARARPFSWGNHDCCLWAADAVVAVTGEDHAAAHRGTYSDAIGALRLVEELGGLESVCSMAGPEISVMHASSGDIGLVNAGDDGRDCAGVFDAGRWLVVGDEGLLSFPREAASKAWRVGA